MKPANALLCLAVSAHGINAVALPDTDVATIATQAPQPDLEIQSDPSTVEELWKRKGGGGGGRAGGGVSSGGGRGGSSSGGGGRSGGAPLGSPSSNTGGRTTTGSGPPPRFGGFYNGGGSVPYAAGQPSRGISPSFLTGAALGAIAFSGFHYPYGLWYYPYHNPYFYHNSTTNKNETKPVSCVCGAFDTCSCEDTGNQTYFNSIIGNGSYQGLNHSLVNVANNDSTGQSTIYINGQLPNGTTASGGSVSASTAANIRAFAQAAGWWPAAAVALTLAYSL
ncbi:hypothetical protein F4861DRAFT_491408 [Xylaria intraflava]|nr:hypothetical protein F4861DRAFT_491408 [Xylaria intraflava]